ncbi:exosortase [Alteromonas sp. C1M14]|uniref:exosortase n=1 Tax=Alteromonas sp. C1M14 TaxID=2841567 RepID=UPI001C096196|nr:exosortase [Alteromonas sp. C1M14]MBU2979216.1 exosortase [Alteromonas sp. C1M14]
MKSKDGFLSFFSTHPARRLFWLPVLLAAAWALVNYPVMVTLWRHGFDDGTYSHAYLIPFIFIYLIYVLAKTGQLTPRSRVYIPAVVCGVGLCFLYFVAVASQISLLVWVLSLALLANIYWMVFRFSWGLAYTVAFLLFMYPLWGTLQTALQHFSVFSVMNIMSLTGIPTYVENTSVMIPAGTFIIAGGCSGLRYFLVSLAIGTLFVFLNLRRRSAIVKFMLLAIAGALITNWIRIVALVLIGHFSDMQSDLMRDHNNFGWYIYAPFVFILFWYGEKLAKKEPSDPMEDAAPTMATTLSVNGKAVIAASALVLLSSSAMMLSVFSSPQPPEAQCGTFDSLGEAVPLLPYPAYKCVTTVQKNGLKIDKAKVVFDGSDLDGKPTQYQIRYFPESWRMLSRSTDEGWNTVVTVHKGQQHLFAWRFFIDGQTTPSVVGMKKLRLQKAFANTRSSGLDWVHIRCNGNCDAEKVSWNETARAW